MPTPPPRPPPAPAAGSRPAAAGDHCRHCREPLPPGRAVIFCPSCGKRHTLLSCPRCGTELESAWRHCITCGLPVQDPYRFV